VTVTKAVSLHQPWATMIAIGRKTFETRSWPTRHRGPLAIHAARRLEGENIDRILGGEAFDLLGRAYQHLLLDELTSRRYPLGAIVAVANVVDCIRVGEETPPADPGTIEYCLGDYTAGRYAWRLEDVQPLKTPVACRGAQGLWDVPAQTRLDIAGAIT